MSRTISARGSRPYRAVLAAFASLGFAAGTWGARIPDIKEALALDDGRLGTALLGLSVGAVAGAGLGGLVVRRLGSRRATGIGWALVGALLVLPGVAASWATLTVSFLLLGLAVGVMDVAMNGAGIQLEHAAGVPLLSGLHAGWSGGVLAGAVVGSAAVALGVGTGAHLGLVGVALVVACARFAGATPSGVIESVEGPTVEAPDARRWRLAALAGIGGCVFLAEGALLDWSGVLVREDLGGTAVLGALAVTGVSAGGLAGRLAGDSLSLRWGPVALVRRGAIVAAVALAAVLLVSSPLVVPVLLVAVGAGLAPAVPLAFAAAGRLRGEGGIAVATTAGYGAYLLGPALIGGIAHASTLRLALVVPLVLVGLTALLAWSTGPPAPASGPPPPEA